MGLANLVPGVSGGTMLLAVGIYPRCIEALAKMTSLRPDRAAIGILATVAIAGVTVILVLAGPVRDLVMSHRWVMYSLFLGSTLGGVPVVWKLIGHHETRSWFGVAAGLALMVATVIGPSGPVSEATGHGLALFLAGVGAFAAMILPGLSGGYLLVLSGQYIPILGAVDGLASAVVQTGVERWSLLAESARILTPFAAGGLVALFGVSQIVQLMLQRQRALILGFLLGLLVGAVLGLWPFGSDEAGLVLPGTAQAAGAIGLALCGFVVTMAIARLGGRHR